MTPGSIMIFAAGLGTRMGTLTQERPKPLIRVAGKALIDHALDLTTDLPDLRVVVNLHYLAPLLMAHLAGRDIAFSPEPELLETGGGIRQALPLLGPDPVFSLNSDAVWQGPNPLIQLARAWDPARMEALLLLLPPASALGHTGAGDFLMGDDGRLTARQGADLCRGADPADRRLTRIAESRFSLNLLWDQMAARGGLFGLTYPGQWCDVGRPDSIALAEKMLRGADVS